MADAGPLGAFDPSYGINGSGQYDYNGVSSAPGAATPWEPSLQAAMQQWFQANPSYSGDQGGGANDPNASGTWQSGGPGSQAIPNPALTPIPQQQPSASATNGYNPLQPAYLGAPGTLNATTVQPTNYQASQLDPGLIASLGSGPTQAALQASVAPQYAQQDQQMMQMLATSGLSPSSTAGSTIFNNLAQQQLAGISPAMASAIQNSQANQLNAGQFNVGAQNTAAATNAGAANTAGMYNAGAMNSASGQNLANSLQQQLYNTNAYNNAGQQFFNAQTGAYNNNANAFNALNSQGLAGATGLANTQASGGNNFANTQQTQYPIYGGSSGLSGAAGALGGSGGQTSTTNYNYGPNAPNSGYGVGTGYSEESGY